MPLIAPVRAGVVALAAVLIVLATPSAALPTAAHAAGATGAGFVTRSGSNLFVDGLAFRFSGSNQYWLQLDDNVRDATGAPTYPTTYRIDDAMATAQRSGGTVVRAWADSVGCPRCIEPALGSFDDAAFTSLDYAVASAARHGQRLILTLVDNWDYFSGGKLTYTGWRGKPESAFFSDPVVMGDYERFIGHVLRHVDPLTGLAYRDDPTIMAWETGNEMWCQTCAGNFWDGSWTRAIADTIKAAAPQQLVVDGHGTDPACVTGCLHVPSLDIASVDMVDDHFYPPRVARVKSASAAAAAHHKAYLVGEFDWRGVSGGDSLASFLASVQADPVAGDLLWAVVPHADRTGFVDHADGYQMFYPGSSASDDDRSRQLLRHAAWMSGVPARSLLDGAPATPLLSAAVRSGSRVDLTWRGAAGALDYEVQRSSAGGAWTTAASGVSDHRVLYGATWTDLAPGTASAAYRVRARSLGGVVGPWSTVRGVGPS